MLFLLCLSPVLVMYGGVYHAMYWKLRIFSVKMIYSITAYKVVWHVCVMVATLIIVALVGVSVLHVWWRIPLLHFLLFFFFWPHPSQARALVIKGLTNMTIVIS